MVSILAAISSAGMRLGVWNQRRGPKNGPRQRRSRVVTSPHPEPSRDGQALP